MGALTATGQSKYHEGFGRWYPGSNMCLQPVTGCGTGHHRNTCAIIVEPIQGEGGSARLI